MEKAKKKMKPKHLILTSVIGLVMWLLFFMPASDNEIIELLHSMSSVDTIGEMDMNSDMVRDTFKMSVRSKNFPALVMSHIEDLIDNQEYERVEWLLTKFYIFEYPVQEKIPGLDQAIVTELEQLATERDYDNICALLGPLMESRWGNLSFSFENSDLTKFEQLVVEGLENHLDEWSKGMDFLDNLNRLEYHSEYLKTAVSDWLKRVGTYVFSKNVSEVASYIEQVKDDLDENYYASIINCFPYQELKTYIESNGIKAITEDNAGGYYDSLKNEYEDEDYWYDPLSKRKSRSGSVGEYHYTLSHMFFGDFMMVERAKFWYGTDSDSSYSCYVEYMGKDLGSTYRIDWLYILLKAENVYIMREDDVIVLFVIEDAQIIIVSDEEMVTVAYE